MKCKNCGINNPVNVNRCIYCGADLTDSVNNQAINVNNQRNYGQGRETKRNKTDSIIIGLIAALIAVFLIVCGVYAYDAMPRSGGFGRGGMGVGAGGGGGVAVIKTTYTVKFDINYDAENPEDQQINNGDTAEMPSIAKRNGYEFGGWFEDNVTYSKEFDFDSPVKKDVTLYACWVDINDKTDTDGDGLTDSVEWFHKTDKTKADTDGDGLSDYIEICILALNPLVKDTDSNGVPDGDEDADSDGLKNAEEIQQFNTNPNLEDTDEDGLNDFEEVKEHNTDPNNKDTDGDGASDKKEIEFGTDPLTADKKFDVTVNVSENDTLEVSQISGSQLESLKVSEMDDSYINAENIPGYLGKAYDIEMEDAENIQATISFEYISSMGEDPCIYYIDEEKGIFVPVETTVDGNKVVATISHFSKYILIDRTIFDKAFTWEDNWDSSNKFESVEIVLVIDDSGSMGPQGANNDPNNLRLSVAQTLIEKLPVNSKIGIVEFEKRTTKWTESLVSDRDVAIGYLNTSYFQSNGNSTYMYDGIQESFDLFESNEDTTLKMMVVLTDGIANDAHKHSDTIKAANNKGVKIYTVGLGSNSSYFNNYLKPLANNTGGAFYLASDAEQLADIYKDISKKIDVETDSDADGIPDYYEENMVMFNGIKAVLDKYNPDMDGDGLKDGEEIVLTFEYNNDRTKVRVRGKYISDPTKVDSDGDGFDDTVDNTPMLPVCFKDFDSYKKFKYGDQATITIFVDQPFDNSRVVVNLLDNNESVGHTFVGIDTASGSDYAGFWPRAYDKEGNTEPYGYLRAMFRATVDGSIRTIGGQYITDGRTSSYGEIAGYSEKNHKWDVAKTFVLPVGRSASLDSFVKSYTRRYNMVYNNCTTFAVDALKHFGIQPKIYMRSWTLTEGIKSALKTPTNIADTVVGTYIGYSPADAGEDIRAKYDDYIYKSNVTLKNGSVVEAVWEASTYKK